jgi:hypothetical protein
MPIKTQKDLKESKFDSFIEKAKDQNEKYEIPKMKDQKILKGFKISSKLAEYIKILSAKTRKDQSTIVSEAIEIYLKKYFNSLD